MYFPVSATLIEFLILSIVKDQDSYGYDISQNIKLVSNIKESTLYPILKKLEKADYLRTYSQEHQGRQRKYYQLTTEGQTQLAFLEEEWQNYKASLDAIIEGSLRHDKN
ncbi:PadR family transcriptional regulator [Streptococcus pseudoporcinus]|uniref:Transcriptional regulator, PadR family n=2 Tax=Streptococcus pseudoporcinus TaxID=361101 RepID=G5K7G0_9STRE|nr:PadR family transcriptional regulator [Streptococcus pseudoporcinus]EFR44452.1 transcriptional regulator, PadR family [Streptococcus pseudoporcinus SPIN 20026]EHI65683.1 transcriptional regulator, PadR family [Streptococcus pseudoporcinus LQ 940-04]VEF93881.1 PadR family regulatory protein [Streptococcus pseudoporcinus]VTS43335.1 PadR family regulatory protein [Streptococcus pseudoporcinus]